MTREKMPEYMVPLEDPQMLRKEILECLRELIILMQGYEQFRKVQEQKIVYFALLDKKMREINNVIDYKLKPYLPKGKMKTFVAPKPQVKEESPLMTKNEAPAKSELDDLEAQLQEIEGQLHKVQ